MKQIPIIPIGSALGRNEQGIGNADSIEDAKESTQLIEQLVADTRRSLAQWRPADGGRKRADLLLQLGRALLRLEKNREAWDAAREAFDLFAAAEIWDGAVQTCDVMFLADQPDSLAALGQGLWLGVTFPIDPELTVALLKHVIDETPSDSDGAAVAAVTAHYIVDLRANPSQREDLQLYTGQLLATVARRHSGVEGQADFDAWFKRLELDDPSRFLPRLRNVIDVLVQEEWWIDRDALRAKLPD